MSEDGYEAKYDDLLAVSKAAKEYVDLRQKLVNALDRVGP